MLQTWKAAGRKSETTRKHFGDRLVCLARQSKPLSDNEIRDVIGRNVVKYFIERARLIPWVTIRRDETGTLFQVDHELKDICEGRRPRPQLSGESLISALNRLRMEIDRRRTENRDSARRSRWNPDLIKTGEQTNLLNWIEEELANIFNQATSVMKSDTALTDDSVVTKGSACTD